MQVEAIESAELANVVEAVLFASGEPLGLRELQRIFERLFADRDEQTRQALLDRLRPAIEELEQRWAAAVPSRGFALERVAQGWGFRSNARYADALRAMRDERPQRLSRAALETLAIVAYRQPVTKPEVDYIRGVDCSGTMKMLLERNLVRIVGKKEEPGRPLLYGTTKEFLGFFNLASLTGLPALRDVQDLCEESQDELREFDGVAGIEELRASARQLCLEDEPAVDALDEAVRHLGARQRQARDALASEGIALEPEREPEAEAEAEAEAVTDATQQARWDDRAAGAEEPAQQALGEAGVEASPSEMPPVPD